MSEVQTQENDSIQKQEPHKQSYRDSNIHSAETEKLYLKMKEAWL